MSADIIFGGLLAVAIIGGGWFAIRLGKEGPSVPKTGGQVPVDTTSPEYDRRTSLDPQQKPAAE